MTKLKNFPAIIGQKYDEGQNGTTKVATALDLYTNSELFYGLELPGEQRGNFPLSDSKRRDPLRYNLDSKILNKTC